MKKNTLTCILAALLTPCVYAEVPIELLSHIGGYDGFVSPSPAWSVAVNGDLAYVGLDDSLCILDISQLSAPAQLARLEFATEGITGIAVHGQSLRPAHNRCL